MFQHYSKPKENNFGFEKSGLYYNLAWDSTKEEAQKKIPHKPIDSDNPAILLYVLSEEDGYKNHNVSSMLKFYNNKLVEIALYITVTDKSYSKDITNEYYKLLSNQYGEAKEDLTNFKWDTNYSQISFSPITEETIAILIQPKEII